MTVPRGKLSRSLRFQILRRDGNACRYCGAMAPEVKLTVDHVIPVAHGGTDDPENLTTACADCNAGKAALPPDAEVVAQVARDQERWARAMALAAQAEATVREITEQTTQQWLAEWNRWSAGDGRPIPVDDDWKIGIRTLMAAGLSLQDLCEAVPVAMRKSGVLTENRYRYFCGIAWTTLRQRQERARRIIESGEV